MSDQDHEITKNSLMQKHKKYFRIGLYVLADIFTVIISVYMPMVWRFGIYSIEPQYLVMAKKWIVVDILTALAVIAAGKLYNRVWAFASVDEMIDCFKASLIIEAIYIIYKTIFGVNMFRSYYPFSWMILLILLFASRSAIRFLRTFRARVSKDNDQKKIMVIGGGAAASVLLKELSENTGNSKAVCIIDDNRAKKGKLIHNVPIIGGRGEIANAVEKYRVNEIIIAIPSAPPAEVREIIKICQETKVKVRIMPAIASTLTSSVTSTIREINYEDLLGREPVVIANSELAGFVKDKTVLVTGGGGSIGSELCRQIAANKPGRLLILDIYENTTYELERELDTYYPELNKKVLIASVRDYDRLDSIFEEYKPDFVYHAAAHKHVPLMEYSPNEAIKNNCKGTLNVVKLADKHGVKRMVLISTDKAVRPTNVMGASKRICEMLIQAYNKRSATEYVAVRFGNVLGSNGSVIPFFLKQIEAGGPVTLTHREITRFFMTIPEAVSLVLKAGLMAKGGEIFILDMGEPVKIYDLACSLIRMKGYEPNKDIHIDIIGLRPGEKLYEELLMDEEGLQETENSLIHIGKPISIDENVFFEKLENLIVEAEKNSDGIREYVKDICPTYNLMH